MYLKAQLSFWTSRISTYIRPSKPASPMFSSTFGRPVVCKSYLKVIVNTSYGGFSAALAEEQILQDDVGLYFCSMNGKDSSHISHLEVDQFGNISNWPPDFFGDQFGEIAAMTDAALLRQEKSK